MVLKTMASWRVSSIQVRRMARSKGLIADEVREARETLQSVADHLDEQTLAELNKKFEPDDLQR